MARPVRDRFKGRVLLKIGEWVVDEGTVGPAMNADLGGV
jgi:hypothetical protein